MPDGAGNSRARKLQIVKIMVAVTSLAACIKYLGKQDPCYIVLAVILCPLFAWVSGVKERSELRVD
jgi:hypothetical protein